MLTCQPEKRILRWSELTKATERKQPVTLTFVGEDHGEREEYQVQAIPKFRATGILIHSFFLFPDRDRRKYIAGIDHRHGVVTVYSAPHVHRALLRYHESLGVIILFPDTPSDSIGKFCFAINKSTMFGADLKKVLANTTPPPTHIKISNNRTMMGLEISPWWIPEFDRVDTRLFNERLQILRNQ